jgi:hypothetical protein
MPIRICRNTGFEVCTPLSSTVSRNSAARYGYTVSKEKRMVVRRSIDTKERGREIGNASLWHGAEFRRSEVASDI